MSEAVSSDSGVVLFVEDDADVLATAQALLRRHGVAMAAARTPAEAWSVLAGTTAEVILLDLNFRRGDTSGAEGLAWLRELRAHDPEAVVVVVTGHSGLAIAVEAMKAGASDFLTKPWTNARFMEALGAAQALARQRRQASGRGAAEVAELPALIGDSPAMQQVRALVGRAAPTDASVVFFGPAGSGRSLAARTLHARSRRADRPLVILDARGLAEGRGAAALREAADAARGGTLLLDEAGMLPRDAQGALMAALEVGADMRLAATVTGSREALAALRPDLADRLTVVEVFLPPLAERGQDAVVLAEHFARLFARRYSLPARPLDASAREALVASPPAGEVRGLRQAVERAVVLGAGPVLTSADFSPAIAPAATGPTANDLNLARSEKAMVAAALKRNAHNVSRAAKELGLTRAALYRRMVKHGL